MGALPQSLSDCIAWYVADVQPLPREEVSNSRDIFQARLDRMLRELLRGGWPTSEASLAIALLGEVGNNSFDHNLGRWPDVPGCWLGHDASAGTSLFWIVDRGVGFLGTLSRVVPSLATPQQAIEVAFARIISGRAPERRGNGLKFVRSVVNANANRALYCQSATGRVAFGGCVSALSEVQAQLANVSALGVATFLVWKRPS